MNSAIVGALAASIGVPIVIALLARLFPTAEVDRFGPGLDELGPRYRKWETVVGLLLCVLCAPIALSFWWCLRRMADWHAALLPKATITLTTMSIYWLLPAMFLSMVAAAPLVTIIAKRLLKDRYREFERYQALKYGFDQTRVNRLFVSGTVVACALAIFLGLDWYVLITNEEVVLNRLLGVSEERHPISSIVGIRTAPELIAPSGKVVHRREYVVSFAEGRHWSTSSLPADLDEAEKGVVIGRLSEKSGVPIEEIEQFQRGEW